MLRYGFEFKIDFTIVKSFTVFNNGKKRNIDEELDILDEGIVIEVFSC